MTSRLSSTIPETTKARAARMPPVPIRWSGVRRPHLVNNGYTKLSKTGTNARISNGLAICNWSALMVATSLSLPSIRVAWNVHLDPCYKESSIIVQNPDNPSSSGSTTVHSFSIWSKKERNIRMNTKPVGRRVPRRREEASRGGGPSRLVLYLRWDPCRICPMRNPTSVPESPIRWISICAQLHAKYN